MLRPSAQEFKNKVKDKPVVILEAGVYRGYYSKELYAAFNCERLYLMDKWYTSYENGKYNVPEILDYAKTAMSFFDMKDEVMIIKADSLLFDLWPNNHFDYVYLDNDHSYLHCCKEFPLYWDKVKSGGMISGDNYEAPGVRKALDEFCKENGVSYEVGTWKKNADGTPRASDWWIWKK
jgi:predicted O-methyltransferase YrrM